MSREGELLTGCGRRHNREAGTCETGNPRNTSQYRWMMPKVQMYGVSSD